MPSEYMKSRQNHHSWRRHSMRWAPLGFLVINPTNVMASSVSPAIIGLVPSCAQSCFQSFIKANYPSATCGSSPSLQCLCQETGSSGVTLGEGALQCIIAEINFGACAGDDASASIVSNGYAICSAEPSAAPETHPTMTATLLVPPSGGLLVPSSVAATSTQQPTPVTTNSSGTLTASTASISTPTSTEAPLVIATTQSSASSSSTGTTSSPSSTSTATSTTKNLSTAQIGGISVGVAAGVLVAVLIAIIVIRRTHRNRLLSPENEQSAFARFSDPFNPRQKRGHSTEILPVFAPRFPDSREKSLEQRPHRLEQQRPNIGLAIAPHIKETTASTTPHLVPPLAPSVPGSIVRYEAYVPPLLHSKQSADGSMGTKSRGQDLDPRPALTLSIPTQALLHTERAGASEKTEDALLAAPDAPFSGGRDSVVTEFAEDGEIDSSTGPSSQIWRPLPSNPIAVTPRYIAEPNRDWEMTNASSQHLRTAHKEGPSELEAKGPLTPNLRSTAPSDFENRPNQLLSPANITQRQQTSTSEFRQQPNDSGRLQVQYPSRNLSTSSSIYSIQSAPRAGASGPIPFSRAPPVTTGEQRPVPQDQSKLAGRRSSAGRNGRSRTQTMMSNESATTVALSDDTDFDDIDEDIASSRIHRADSQQQVELSPVVESPRSPGTSPVTYPKIPYPQSNDDFRARDASLVPAGLKLLPGAADGRKASPAAKSSPTLGVVRAGESHGASYPSQSKTTIEAQGQSFLSPRVPRPGLHPVPNLGQSRTDSPNMPLQQENRTQIATHNMPQTDGFLVQTHSLPRYGLPRNPRDGPLPRDRKQPRRSPISQMDTPSTVTGSEDFNMPYMSHGRNASLDLLLHGKREPPPAPRASPGPRTLTPRGDQQQQQAQRVLAPQQGPNQHQAPRKTPPAGVPRPSQYPGQQRHTNTQNYRAYAGPGQPVPGHHYTQSTATSSDTSTATPSHLSNASTLLSKRLGPERAAALAMGSNNSTDYAGYTTAQEHQYRGLVPPRTPEQRGAGAARNKNDPLPATPGWKPKLTPRRLGDDLFLSVQ